MARIRNHSIGVLLQDLTSGVDVLDAVGRYEHIVAPQNYKRPKPIFTQKMVRNAQETVERLGLVDSLPRRHAHLDDITINNVLWANRDAAREMDGLGVFAELAEEATLNPRSFEHLPGIDAEGFVGDKLPTASDVRVFLENRHESNLVSLIAPQHPGAPSLFKWDNNFGWAYNGNVTDSMKARVKALGGDVTGVLRFSIQWNENGDNGFRAEIEFNGTIHEFDYPKELRQGEKVQVASVKLSGDATFEIVESLPSTTSSRQVWGLTTNQFHPVSVVTYSPNHWDDRGVGNRHYFLILAGCVNPEQPNGFFNEYLKEDLMEQKRVFAALGSKMRVEQSETQLSGVGFNSTTRASLTVKVDGKAMRIIF